MKNFGSTLIFALIVAAVGVYTYVVEYKGAEKKETAKQEALKLVPWKSDDVMSFTSSSGDNTLEVAKSASGDWELIAPVKDLADTTQVNSLLSQILEQKSESVVEEGEKLDWTLFGLDKPKGQITLKGKEGKSVQVIVGANEAMGGRRYVRLNDENKVYLASVLWDGLVTKVPKDLRDRRVVRKSKDQIKFFKLTVKSNILEFEKGEKGWTASRTPGVALDNAVIDGFLETVLGLKATDFAAESKNDKTAQTKFRLKEKGPELQIQWNDNTTLVAQPTTVKDGKAFLTVSGADTIFEVAGADVERWSKSLDDFRDKKRPFEFKRDEVKEIEIKTGLTQLGLKKEDSSWALKNPDPAKDVDQEKVTHLFEKMEGMRAEKFMGKSTAFGKAKGEMVFKDQAGQVLFELKWGDNSKDPKILLVKTNRTEEILGVDANLISGLPSQTLTKDKAPSAVASPAGQASPAPSASAAKVGA